MKFVIYRTSGCMAFEDLEELNKELDIDLKKYNVYLEPHISKYNKEEVVKYAIIDIKSSKELMQLNKDYGDIVIQKPDFVKGIPEIEIYDTYRE